jgi:multimeric flavodoxin WrbA
MKVLAINGTYRAKGNTSRLTDKALEGAKDQGAETEHVKLVEKDIQYCTTCHTCYLDRSDDPIAPCPIKDDVRAIQEKMREADGVIFSSPVHASFMTALLFAFLERCLFTLTRPTGSMKGIHGCPEPRLADKARAMASIACAGGITQELRHTCDMITPTLAWFGSGLVNGMPLGDLFAGAHFSKEMEDEDWERAFTLRVIAEEQLQEAYDLGAKMANAIKAGDLPPFDITAFDPNV